MSSNNLSRRPPLANSPCSTSDATLYSDGGGRVAAIGRPIHGAAHISRFFVGIRNRISPDTKLRFAIINGETGVLMISEGRIYNAISFELEGDRVRGIYIVRNPEKLRHLANALHEPHADQLARPGGMKRNNRHPPSEQMRLHSRSEIAQPELRKPCRHFVIRSAPRRRRQRVQFR